jgi:hypothetical protein
MVRELSPAILIAVMLLIRPCSASELRLEPQTLKLWDAYVAAVERRAETFLNGSANPAWDRRSNDLRSCQILAVPAKDHGLTRIPGGLIHDWTGLAFIPNATVSQVLSVLLDYDHYKDFYAPTVVQSKAISIEGNNQRFSMDWYRKVFAITTYIEADYSSSTVFADSRRGCIFAKSIRIQEIRNFGSPDQQKLPPDMGRGYIWRVCSVLQLQEIDAGVFLELEALVLSRGIPNSVRWIAEPIVNHLSRCSVIETLSETRRAVQERRLYAGMSNRQSR